MADVKPTAPSKLDFVIWFADLPINFFFQHLKLDGRTASRQFILIIMEKNCREREIKKEIKVIVT